MISYVYMYIHMLYMLMNLKSHTQSIPSPMTRSRNFPRRPMARCFRGCIEVQSGCRTQCTTCVGSAGLKLERCLWDAADMEKIPGF